MFMFCTSFFNNKKINSNKILETIYSDLLLSTMKYIFLIALSVVAASALTCPPNACKFFKCLPVENCVDGEIGKGLCGCCDICIKHLNEGDPCFLGDMFGSLVTSKCGLNLVCSRRSRTCIKPLNCTQLKSETKGKNLLGAFIPRCETDGTFSAVQCHGSVCFCAHTDGTRIPGFQSAIHEIQGMNCNCARHKFAYGKTGLIGKLFHCESNGNYNKIQCTGSACYCVDEVGKQVGESVHVSQRKSMTC
ncbi:Hypothetical predicted protein [Octopus vulgaris]|uniref:Thyroglobulin type-1 domain-containing protein n=1 Tax=Octopus vulgaris TaxID=6645 RepID=A0AA36BK74_OCTVU|nr:Hypothetical predicted protein [Octopus vulgaris]